MESSPYFILLPSSGKGPGVFVLHAWWGLNEFIQSFCQRLSREGFVVLAPDLYHGRIAQTIEEAEKLRGKMNRARAAEEILAAQAALRSHPAVTAPKTGLIGFSLGAYLSLWLAGEHPEGIGAVTVFYGASGQDLSASEAAFQGHFAESDPYTSASGVKKMEKNLRTAGRPVDFYTYPGTGHWFFEDDRPDAFNPAAARLAWERTTDFLHQHLS